MEKQFLSRKEDQITQRKIKDLKFTKIFLSLWPFISWVS